VLAVITGLPFTAYSTDAQRQAEVEKRGADVMPFSLKTTSHSFAKSNDGGTQRVVAKDASDSEQVQLVRAHLREIQKEIQRGDFSGPSHIHGKDMPELAQLKAEKPSQISIDYQDVAGGGELTFHTRNAKLVKALHTWFDAQLSDHGADAMEGHRNGDMPMK
jgi:hypothetical protein